MLEIDKSKKAIRNHFTRHKMADINQLFQVLQTRSRMSVFRRLRAVGYHSSYTHTGRYYTLQGIPVFDELGLWFHQGVGFSRWGSLKGTIEHLVENSAVGQTHAELGARLRVRVQNALLMLVREKRLSRQHIEHSYLYTSTDAARRAQQVASRQAQRERGSRVPLEPSVVVEVLSEVIQAADVIVSPSVVAGRLAARGVSVSVEQVEMVYGEHSIEPGKKTAH